MTGPWTRAAIVCMLTSACGSQDLVCGDPETFSRVGADGSCSCLAGHGRVSLDPADVRCVPLSADLCPCDTTAACDPGCDYCDLACAGCTPAPRVTSRCDGGDVYWFDGCGVRGDLRFDCGAAGCAGDACGLPASCASHGDCPATHVCDRATTGCVECRTTADCDAGLRCASASCTAASFCDGDLDCAGQGMVCDLAGSRCVECNTAADCGTSACIGKSCIAASSCESSLECAADGMVCGEASPPEWPVSTTGQACAECNVAGDCGAGEGCHDRTCAPVCRGYDYVCGEIDGANCGSCSSGSDCLGIACGEGLPAWAAQYVVDGGDRIYLAEDGRSYGGGIWEVIGDTGYPQEVASFSGYLDGLAANSEALFWATTEGLIYRRNRSGGQPVMVGDVRYSDSSWCQGIGVNDDWVVCAMVDYDSVEPSGLYRIPADGGEPERFSSVTQPGLRVAGDYAYWADGDRVGRTEITTGLQNVLVYANAYDLWVVGPYVYYDVYSTGLNRILEAGGTSELVGYGVDVVGGSDTKVFLSQRETTGYDQNTWYLLETDLDLTAERVLFSSSVRVGAALARGGNSLFGGADLVVLLDGGGVRLSR